MYFLALFIVLTSQLGAAISHQYARMEETMKIWLEQTISNSLFFPHLIRRNQSNKKYKNSKKMVRTHFYHPKWLLRPWYVPMYVQTCARLLLSSRNSHNFNLVHRNTITFYP